MQGCNYFSSNSKLDGSRNFISRNFFEEPSTIIDNDKNKRKAKKNSFMFYRYCIIEDYKKYGLI